MKNKRHRFILTLLVANVLFWCQVAVGAADPAGTTATTAGPLKPEIHLKLRIHALKAPVAEVNADPDTAELERMVGSINQIWAQAGIRFELELVVRDAARDEAAQREWTVLCQQGGQELMGKLAPVIKRFAPELPVEPGVLHLVIVHRFPGGFGGRYFPELGLVVAPQLVVPGRGSTERPLEPRIMAHELGHALSLQHVSLPENLMTSGPGARGTRPGEKLTEKQIAQARETAASAKPLLLSQERAAGPMAGGNNPAAAQFQQTGPATPGRGGQPGRGGGGRTLSLDELFDQLDKDHDGRISKEEATGIYAQRFSQWDANGDGYATRQEIHDFRMRLGIDDSGQRIAANASDNSGAPPAAGGGPGGPRARRGGPGGQGAPSGGGTPTMLKGPEDWRFEALPVPAAFAPDIQLKGNEEIRFAPGMFDNTASNYWTCALVIAAEGAPALGASEVKDFVQKYYRGLSVGLGQRKGLSIDAAQMNAVVTPSSSGPDATNRYTAQMVFFDSFTDGRKVILNIEAHVVRRPDVAKTYLILLVSPQPKAAPIWKTLRGIEDKLDLGTSANQSAVNAGRGLAGPSASATVPAGRLPPVDSAHASPLR